jgi:small subunit ribosomal protein S8e
MGISRDSRKKRRLTGGRMPIHQKKRKYEIGRQASHTKLGDKKVVLVRGRGGNIKRRALRLNEGNFSWISEKIAKKCKIINVIYNATNNELVRTNTIVKGCIVVIDPSPFKFYWYIHYDDSRGGKLPTDSKAGEKEEEKAKNKDLQKHIDEKKAKFSGKHKYEDNPETKKKFEDHLEKSHHFFNTMKKGKLLARITSRPGQSGRADGYLLEGKELDFYQKKIDKK